MEIEKKNKQKKHRISWKHVAIVTIIIPFLKRFCFLFVLPIE